MPGGPGPVNCQIRHKDDGTARCETHSVDFGTAGADVVRAHIEEANRQWKAQQDFLEQAAKGGWGTAFGPIGAFMEVLKNAWEGSERKAQARDEVQERMAKALERIADVCEALNQRVDRLEKVANDLGREALERLRLEREAGGLDEK